MCGCVAQQDKEEVRRRAPYVDLVFGTLNIPALPELIKRIENDEKVVAIEKTPISRNEEKSRIIRATSLNAWVPIIDGCDYFCTYWDNQCYLVPISECSAAKKLRFIPPKNGQKVGITYAKDYEIQGQLEKLKG